jgi:uncharacterized protein YbjT (DUF2867 family)
MFPIIYLLSTILKRDGDKMKALVLGSTGMIGSALIDQLLIRPEFMEVYTFSRTPTGKVSSKLKEQVIDHFLLIDNPEYFNVDCLFYCLGSTKKKAGSNEAFRKMEIELIEHISEQYLRSAHQPKKFILLSSIGANNKSQIPYLKTKGKVEQIVKSKKFKDLQILRPSLLIGQRHESRIAENFAIKILKPFSDISKAILGKYSPVRSEELIDKMIAKSLR